MTPAVSDSVVLGTVAFALSLAILVLLYFGGEALGSRAGMFGLFTSSCAAPTLSLINVPFILRDRKAGRVKTAKLGAFLSAAAVFVGWLPFLLAD